MGRDVVSCDVTSLVTEWPVALAWAPSFVRDEEAAGSNPATPTQVTGRARLSGVATYIGE